MNPPLHRYGAVQGAHLQRWPKEIPIPHHRRPQLFAGAGRNGDLYDCHRMPRELIRKLKNASYIGCGFSSDVWDLKNGTVLKITNENAIVAICRFLEKNHTAGFPHVHQTVNGIRRLGFKNENSWKRERVTASSYTAIVQKKYDIISLEQWGDIKSCLQHLDFSDEPGRFGRGSDGKAARGKEGQDIACQMAMISNRLKKTDPSHPLAQCSVAIATLYHWMRSGMLDSNAGLDVDHSDNWAQDEAGHPVLLDPIYTVKSNPNSAMYLTPFLDEPIPSF